MAMITVNLTTTKNRLYLCSQAVWSLAHQTVHIDAIRVWVSKEPYLIDEGIESEPEWVREINSLGKKVEFRWVENTGPYRKIFPALLEADPNDILVYADDDIAYGSEWLESLLNEFIACNQKMVVASRVVWRRKNPLGYEVSYLGQILLDESISLDSGYIITGVGGVILKRSHIKEELIKNKDYLLLAPKGDDVWISKIIQESGTKLRVVPSAIEFLTEIVHDKGLHIENLKKFKHGKGIVRLFNKIKRVIITNLGYPCCNTDLDIKRVDSYFDK